MSAHLIATADGSDVTTGTTTVYVTGDGGTQASGGTATHEGNGSWSFLPSQANTNYDHVIFTFENASAVNVDVQIYPVSYDPTDSVRLGLTALPNAAADAAGGLPISDAGGLDLDTQLAATNEVTAARMGALTDWIDGGRLDLLLDAIPTTAMRGTDSAALASVWTVARAGALTDWIDGGRLDLLLDAIPTTAMRGTDSAATAANLATVDSNVDTLVAKLVGITLLNEWLGALAGKQASNATAQTEMRASGAGSGTYDATTDSLEALRDNQSAGGGTTQRIIMGGITGSGTSLRVDMYMLVDGVLAAGADISSATVVSMEQNGTDLTWVEASNNEDASGAVTITGTVSTAPSANQMVYAKVQITHGGSARDGMVQGVILSA